MVLDSLFSHEGSECVLVYLDLADEECYSLFLRERRRELYFCSSYALHAYLHVLVSLEFLHLILFHPFLCRKDFSSLPMADRLEFFSSYLFPSSCTFSELLIVRHHIFSEDIHSPFTQVFSHTISEVCQLLYMIFSIQSIFSRMVSMILDMVFLLFLFVRNPFSDMISHLFGLELFEYFVLVERVSLTSLEYDS